MYFGKFNFFSCLLVWCPKQFGHEHDITKKKVQLPIVSWKPKGIVFVQSKLI
jgi:hypothetical protein